MKIKESITFQVSKTSFPGGIYFFSMGMGVVAYALLVCIALILKGKRVAEAVSPHGPKARPKAKPQLFQLQVTNLHSVSNV